MVAAEKTLATATQISVLSFSESGILPDLTSKLVLQSQEGIPRKYSHRAAETGVEEKKVKEKEERKMIERNKRDFESIFFIIAYFYLNIKIRKKQ